MLEGRDGRLSDISGLQHDPLSFPFNREAPKTAACKF